MKIAVANFKANLSESEAKNWLTEFSKLAGSSVLTDKEIILCPPLIYLELFRWSILKDKLPVKLGAQVVSEYSEGSHTGEITAAMLSTYVQYALIGHSEERKIRQLTTDSIQEKIKHAIEQGIKVILCTQQRESYKGEIYALAYEPEGAIGTGAAADPEASFVHLSDLKSSQSVQYGLYGGSVNPENVSLYSKAGFEGVLVGKQSLDPHTFWAITENL